MANISKTKYTSQYIDNMGFDDELKVPMVEIISKDGVLVNPATEETLQAVLAATGGTTYNYIQSEEGATYKYYGYSSSTGWQIKRKTLASGVWEIASGLFTGSYSTYDLAWADKAIITFNYA
jgi:hypothetical protein